MSRRIRLKKAFLFYTIPDRRIQISQLVPEAELPEGLKPHELKQISTAIRKGQIEVVEDSKSDSPDKGATQHEDNEEDQAETFLKQPIAKIEEDLVKFLSHGERKDEARLWVRKLITLEKKSEKPRETLIKNLGKFLEKLGGIDEGIKESEQEVIKIKIGMDDESADSNDN